MTSDIVVNLLGGVYNLSTPLNFTGADSGTSGHSIRWQAAPQQTPVFTAGAKVTGWSQVNSSLNLWAASIGSGVSTRDLWVNGVRATLANGGGLPSGTTQTATGYVIPSPALQSLTSPADLEFVFNPGDWVQDICGVASVTGNASQTTVTMDQPCFGTATSWVYAPIGLPASIVNAREYVTSPGQWSFNSSTHTIYYIPPAGVTMSTADAEIGTATTVINLNGTEASPVSGVSFNGITFNYTSWNAVSGTQGFVEPQADLVFPDQSCAANWNSSTVVTPSGGASANGLPYGSCAVTMPAAVQVHAGRNITFERDTFSHLGTAGITFDGGTQDSSIVGDTFSDVGGNGVQIGSVRTPNQSDSALVDTRNTVSDNMISSAAAEYNGGVAIWAGYTSYLTVAHNEIANSAYTGISVGWGWGSLDTLPSIDSHNQIIDNVLRNGKLVRRDGGAIYTLGPQPNGTISGNYLINDPGAGAALYLDGGSAGWTVTNNVETNVNAPFFNNSNSWDPTPSNTVSNTYTTDPNFTNGHSTVSGTVALNLNAAWPAGATSIVGAAGIEPQYAASAPLTYQAEDATLSGGATVANANGGFHGAGYVSGYTAVGASTSFSVVVPATRTYSVALRYANSQNATGSVDIYVNGALVMKTTLAELSSADAWGTKSENLRLTAGPNTIAYRYDSTNTGSVALDDITIPVYEAENGDPVGRATPFSDTAASKGTAVQNLDTVGSGVRFFNAPTSSQLSLTYATPTAGTYSLYVNGTKVQSLPVQSSGAWSGSYVTSSYYVNIPLAATVTLQHDSGDVGINLDDIAFTLAPPARVEAESALLIGRAAAFADAAASGGTAVQRLDTLGDGIQFSNVPAASQLTLTYATPTAGTYSLYINGAKSQTLSIFSSGSWSGSYVTTAYPVSIPAGATVKLEHDSGDTGINLDYIAYAGGAVQLEAESAGFVGRAIAYADAAASGGQGVQQLDTAGDGVQFVGVPAASQLTLRFATPSAGTYSLYVNGTKSQTLSVASSGSWTGAYVTAAYPVSIPASATIRLQHDSGDTGINLDFIQLR